MSRSPQFDAEMKAIVDSHFTGATNDEIADRLEVLRATTVAEGNLEDFSSFNIRFYIRNIREGKVDFEGNRRREELGKEPKKRFRKMDIVFYGAVNAVLSVPEDRYLYSNKEVEFAAKIRAQVELMDDFHTFTDEEKSYVTDEIERIEKRTINYRHINEEAWKFKDKLKKEEERKQRKIAEKGMSQWAIVCDKGEYVMMRFKDNWADEMDIEAVYIESSAKVRKYLDGVVKMTFPYSVSFGTNEFIEYDNPDDYIACLELKPLSYKEFEAVRKIFGTGRFESIEIGKFPWLEGEEDEDLEDEE